MLSIKNHSYKFFLFLSLFSVSQTYCWPWKNVLRWDWSTIATEKTPTKEFLQSLDFPSDFQWGIGDSAFQTEGTKTANGHIENNWTSWPIENGQQVGTAADRWDRYQEDIDNMVSCGFDTYRMSVEWAKIQPQERVFDADAMQHYIDVAKYAKSKGLNVVVVLWHHTWPTWFYDDNIARLDGFESIEGIPCFVWYAEYVVKHLHPYVKTWIPFNEPDGYAMQGFYRGQYPPGKKSLQLAGQVIGNMLKAHVRTSKMIKQIDPDAKVGITKIVQHIDPYRWWNPLEVSAAALFDYLVNTSFINFFKDGIFSWYIPGWVNVYHEDKDGPDSIDFFGVNYYSHSNIRINLLPKPGADAKAAQEGEIITDNGHVMYPEGLYRAIERCSVIGKPMIVTENGLADAHDNYREEFIKKHLYALAQARADGFDVRGYHWWSYCDNFEWCHGYHQKFGLYEIDFENGKKRILRTSAKPFIEFLKEEKLKKQETKIVLFSGHGERELSECNESKFESNHCIKKMAHSTRTSTLLGACSG